MAINPAQTSYHAVNKKPRFPQKSSKCFGLQAIEKWRANSGV
jgi:hypothetical protein